MRIFSRNCISGVNSLAFKFNSRGEQYNNNLKRFLNVCTSVMYEYILQVVRTEACMRTNNSFILTLRLNIDNQQWQYAMNRFLPNDIYVKSVQTVDENFHCRYDCVGKRYRYKSLSRRTS